MKTSRGLLWCYKDEPIINSVGTFIDFSNDNNNASLKSKQKITGQTRKDGTKDVHIMVPLRYLSNCNI